MKSSRREASEEFAVVTEVRADSVPSGFGVPRRSQVGLIRSRSSDSVKHQTETDHVWWITRERIYHVAGLPHISRLQEETYETEPKTRLVSSRMARSFARSSS